MKTLVLFGSPHKDGDTAALWAAVSEKLPGEVKFVSAYDCGISPCIDCRFCWEHPGCAIQDGMQDIYAYLGRCDNVVIASPIYFSELTGPLLGLASRLQTYWAARFFRKEPAPGGVKRGALLLAGGGDGSPAKAEGTARTLFRFVNAQCVGEAFSLHTNEIPASEDEQAMQKARELGEKLAEGTP